MSESSLVTASSTFCHCFSHQLDLHAAGVSKELADIHKETVAKLEEAEKVTLTSDPMTPDPWGFTCHYVQQHVAGRFPSGGGGSFSVRKIEINRI